MQLSKRQINQLTKIVAAAQQLLTEARASGAKPNGRAKAESPMRRRRGKELTAFKKTIKAERKAGASVADLAQKFGVTPSYIYQLR